MSDGPAIEVRQEREGSAGEIRKALVISVSDYGARLQTLDFCENDGQDTYHLFKSLGYKIAGGHKLIGHVTYESMREAIMDFFTDVNNKAEDTLLFYYSGHGIPDVDGDIYLASSEIDPDAPYRRGFSFNELTKMIQRSVSIRIVTVLDCCYSGAAKLSKGHEEDAAKLGTAAIDNRATVLQQGEGKCLLAASQAAQEAYALKEGDHSIFTYYLLQGLKGTEKSVDADGNITPYSLGNYVYRSILNLPSKKRPKQKPITKVEASGDIILASYPNLARSKEAVSSISSSPIITEKESQLPAPPVPQGTAAASSERSSPLPYQPIDTVDTTPPARSIKPRTKEPSHYYYEKQAKKEERRPGINLKILLPIIGAIAIVGAVVAFSLNQPSDIQHGAVQESHQPTSNMSTVDNQTNEYQFVRKWGSEGSADGEFLRPNAVAVDTSGNVYVTELDNDRIQKFDSEGNFMTKWGSAGTGNGRFSNPTDVAVDTSGDVYVAEYGNSRIQKFDSEGNFMTKWGSAGTGNGQFDFPNAVAVDTSGNVYVVDAGNSRIQEFDSNGNFVTKWGSRGTDDGQFKSISSVSVDTSDNVYAVDSNNHRIQKFDSDGNFLLKWGSEGTGDGQFYYPEGTAVDASGLVYVADSGNNRIQVFAPSKN